MRQTLKIAANELRTLFFSPIAWILLVVFLFQLSATYIDLLRSLLRNQAINGPADASLTGALLTGMFGLYTAIQQELYLYLPLLTMGLLSREKSAGTIKLLYSSPVTSTRIVAGKYLAMLFFGLVMSLLLAIPVAFSATIIPAFDIPLALSGLLGIYLLVAAYAAIGLYMSSLTAYQVVAATATLAALAFFNFVGNIWQGIPVMRDITYWLSIKGRTAVLVDGLICSEEITYFLFVIILFLALAVMKIESRRSRRSLLVNTGRRLALVAAIILAGYITSRPRLLLYSDLTAGKTNTLSPESQKIMNSINGQITITAITNILGENLSTGLPASINRNLRLFKPYIRFKPDTRTRYLYYYHRQQPITSPRLAGMTDKEIVDLLLQNAGARVGKVLEPRELLENGEVDPGELATEEYRFYWRISGDNGNHASIRLFQDMMHYPSEAEISAAIKRVASAPARARFTTGHGERNPDSPGDRDYYIFAKRPNFRHSLANQGFETSTIDPGNPLEMLSPGKELLVIAAPVLPFSPTALDCIRRFIEEGGNMLVLGEPGSANVLNPLLGTLGTRLEGETLLQTNETFDANLLACRLTSEGKELFGMEKTRQERERIVMPGATSIITSEHGPLRCTPLLLAPDLPGDTLAVPATPPRATAIALSRLSASGEQRVIVTGDADCFSNLELGMVREGIHSGNFSFLAETFRWLSGGEYPVDTHRLSPRDVRVTLTLASLAWLRPLFSWCLPLLLLSCFLVIRSRRRDR
ncbi:MAG: Gldg family protein [Odoribacteraceae bacterium]|jgi:ABC-2 type transport system permease protein|nr:Gldg family protein [Odoribacteraceae bacterium]